MTTKTGYITDGTYIKFKSGFTGRWVVETEKGAESFKELWEADAYIITLLLEKENEKPKH